MVKGIGIDLTEIDRMKNTNISQKVFLSSEIIWANEDPEKLAILWSIKEALVKSIGTGFRKNILWKDIEIIPIENSYNVKFSKKTIEFYNIANDMFHISVTNFNNMIFAQVIRE
jgi:holo-[acyl-carrier protein] synthase